MIKTFRYCPRLIYFNQLLAELLSSLFEIWVLFLKCNTKPGKIKNFDKKLYYTVPIPGLLSQSRFLQLYLSLHLNDKPDGTQTMLAELELVYSNIKERWIDCMYRPRKEMKCCRTLRMPICYKAAAIGQSMINGQEVHKVKLSS